MRRLAEIREKNKRKDLLFTGMEERPVDLPKALFKNEEKLLKEVITPYCKEIFKTKKQENKL